MNKIFFLISLFLFSSLLAKNDLYKSHSVSFIIPCYNCEKTVEESIASIYQQELSIAFEVICTDDCSTDETKLVLKKCAQKYPNLLVFSHEKNKGGGAARNTCTLHSKGDLIFNLDSDNVLVPNSINSLINLIDETNSDIASFHYAKFFEGNYNEIHRWKYISSNNFADLYSLLEDENSFPSYQGNYLYTRKCFDLVGGYPEDCGALDTTVFGLVLLAAGCKIAILPDPESFYWHRTSTHSYWRREHLNNIINFQKALSTISEVFADEFSDLLWNKDRAEECLESWATHKFKLTSPDILESLFKAYRHKERMEYFEAGNEFKNALIQGCKSTKIYQYMQDMMDLIP
ncbi:MAG: glycosyltransferase family 2 protein [Chlamydiales bacterium]|nr:glycosyltransferase family 2 protein [Chlamydiales bacterium]